MKKALMSLALIGMLSALSAKADSYLYWMVDQTGVSSPYTYASAVLYADNGTTKEAISGALYGDRDSVMVTGNLAPTYVGEGWSYYVELLADDGWMKAKSGSVGWSDAVAGMYAQMQTGGTPKNAVHFTNFTAGPIPEPTSGLLVLLGICGLALKRKRV